MVMSISPSKAVLQYCMCDVFGYWIEYTVYLANIFRKQVPKNSSYALYLFRRIKLLFQPKTAYKFNYIFSIEKRYNRINSDRKNALSTIVTNK